MQRSIVLHDIPIDAVAVMERWYWREHSPEIARRYGPWSARHDSWLPVDVPADARAHGFFNWRLTEGWWRQLPEPGPKGALSFTPPPVWPTVAVCFTPWQPTEDFCGCEQIPSAIAPIRWFVMLRYPETAKREGEDWFLNVFAPAVSQIEDLKRFFSYRTLDPGSLPGTWSPNVYPPSGSVFPIWDRVCELWFPTFSAWRRFMQSGAASVSQPAWASISQFPYLVPRAEIVSTFVLERPADEFLRDPRAYM